MYYRNYIGRFSFTFVFFVVLGVSTTFVSPILYADRTLPPGDIGFSSQYHAIDYPDGLRKDTIPLNKDTNSYSLISSPRDTLLNRDTIRLSEVLQKPKESAKSLFSGGLIIDHTCTNISKIPPYWLNQAKILTFHYAHTSHGSQIITGLEYLENQYPNLNSDVTYGDYPPKLPDDTSDLRIYDGNGIPGGNTYITPDLYWEGESGISYTRYVADTALFQYSMWSWCGQASYYSENSINQYVTILNQLETDYPGMRFIYMTGHSDGGSEFLAQNNDIIREYVRNNNKILFDFNDIETYSPDGNGPYYNDGEAYCEWCDAWCIAHPEQCVCFGDCMSDCAHTHKFFCKLKASAFWWMMARLAGWDGTSGTTPPIASFTANRTSGAVPLTVRFTDTSTGGIPTSWNWSFGDGTCLNTTNSMLRNWTRTYSLPGVYIVRLLVKNTAGESITTPGTIITTNDGGTKWYLDDILDGTPNRILSYGLSSDIPLIGDWDGDHHNGIGVKRGNLYYLDNNLDGATDRIFAYGLSSDTPLVGDWNGDHLDGIGVKRGNIYYLDNNLDGATDRIFAYGLPTDIPLVGDWALSNSDAEGIGVRRSNIFYLDNNLDGTPDRILAYGLSSDTPFVGDWNGDHLDGIAVKRGNVFFIDNNLDGVADFSHAYGLSTDSPLIGDWNGDWWDGLGVFRSGSIS